jgi:hypothetical protein
MRRPVRSRRASGLQLRAVHSGSAMEPTDQARVARTRHRLVAHRGMRMPCQDSISGLPPLFSRPCCQLLGMPLRKVAVAVTAVVTVVVATAVGMVAGILAVAAMVVGILAAALTSAVVVATWVGDRRAPVRLGDRIPAATT